VQACRRGEVMAGDRVLILGCGPIGLALIEVARAYGAEVWATDVNPARLETAAWLGATPVPSENLLRDVIEITKGEGMPVVIEATGVPKVMEQTIDLVASGGRIVIVGLAKKGEGVSFPGLDFTRKEVTILGSRASVNCFPEALRLLASGAIRYTLVATALPLNQAPETFALLAKDQGALHKAVFVLESDQ
jgi:L-gulonate 5-dehydrogenase